MTKLGHMQEEVAQGNDGPPADIRGDAVGLQFAIFRSQNLIYHVVTKFHGTWEALTFSGIFQQN